jgi:spore germination cell wall hydrolase CwlJ-like protein
LNEESNNSVARLPPPEGKKRRLTWIVPVVAVLCLFPVYQSAARYQPGNAGTAGPTRKVVDALNRSRAPAVPAPAAAPESNLLAPLQPASEATLDSMLKASATALFMGPAGDRERAVDCLALAAWYEAGGDLESQRSVVQVVLNRVAHPSFPKSVCGVVFQGSERRTGCQFTFTCDGSMLLRRPSAAALARARAVAEYALQGGGFPGLLQATHYHADYVQPWWSSHLVQRGKVGRHIFYSWPGARGVLPGRPSSAGEAALAQLVRKSGETGVDLPAPGGTAPLDPLATGAQLAEVRLAYEDTTFATPVPKPGNAIFLTVEAAMPSGRWAVAALGRCAGKAECRVFAYESQEQVARNSAASASTREKPLFVFVRDAASRIELALWDCDKVQRPSESQCLPAGGREMTKLLRDSQN